jgi:replication initiation and membrane attachment protein DnaB
MFKFEMDKIMQSEIDFFPVDWNDDKSDASAEFEIDDLDSVTSFDEIQAEISTVIQNEIDAGDRAKLCALFEEYQIYMDSIINCDNDRIHDDDSNHDIFYADMQ